MQFFISLLFGFAAGGLSAATAPAYRGSTAHSDQNALSSIENKVYAAPIKVNASRSVLWRKTHPELQSFNGILHTVNITIGTPPQLFNVSLDLTERGFFVPSIDCDESCSSWREIHRYNASESSTYEPNGTYTVARYWGDFYRGDLCRDDVRVAGMKTQNTTFLPFDYRQTVTVIGISVGFDGMLGLVPPWNDHNNPMGYPTHPTYLSLLADGELLDENIFSLMLPRTLKDEGEVMFGGTNPDLHADNFRTVSLVSDDNLQYQLKGLWNVPIDSVTLNTSVPLHLAIPNYTATIVSEPIIGLPRKFADDILEIIGAEPFNLLWDAVPCDRRPYLPELTFSIGGHNLTITAYDYTFEFEMPFGFEPACIVWFGRNEDWGYGENLVVLGNLFLKGFYTVFDFGSKEMRCEYPKA